jgi:hypothetical protein
LNGILGMILVLSAAGVCGAQGTQSNGVAAKHYRLTVVLSNPQNQESSQRFVLDVPVMPDRPGQAEMNLTTGATGHAETGPKQTLRCTDVHASETGLAANVSYTVDSVSPEPIAGSTEHLISHFVFEKQIDLPLASPTEITDVKALKPIDGSQTPRPAPLQITVTATAL